MIGKTIECDCGFVVVFFWEESDEKNLTAFDWYCRYCKKKLTSHEFVGKRGKVKLIVEGVDRIKETN